MGPRLDSRGDENPALKVQDALALEWGHDWIVVETYQGRAGAQETVA